MNRSLKIARIILSPLIYLIWFGAMSLFLGELCLLMGLGSGLYMFLMGKKIELEHWGFTFVWIVGPYIETLNFIKGDDTEL